MLHGVLELSHWFNIMHKSIVILFISHIAMPKVLIILCKGSLLWMRIFLKP